MAAKLRRCSTCRRGEDETRFGSDRYHCLDCVATRIRNWRKAKKEAAASSSASADPLAGATDVPVIDAGAAPEGGVPAPASDPPAAPTAPPRGQQSGLRDALTRPRGASRKG